MYENLNKIEHIAPILKAAAASEQLNIIFNFNSNSVSNMVLTISENTMGICYHTTGYIYIGAKDYGESNQDILGTLAHEMTHYEMQLAYDNQCKPFDEEDLETCEQFNKILMDVRSVCLRFPYFEDEVVHSIFKLYHSSAYVAELVVRIPEIITKYNCKREQLAMFKEHFNELFKFFFEKTIKDVRERIEKIKPKCEIKKVNSMIGLITEIDSYGLRFQKTISFELKDILIITSRQPLITLASLIHFYRDTVNIAPKISKRWKFQTYFWRILTLHNRSCLVWANNKTLTNSIFFLKYVSPSS